MNPIITPDLSALVDRAYFAYCLALCVCAVVVVVRALVARREWS